MGNAKTRTSRGKQYGQDLQRLRHFPLFYKSFYTATISFYCVFVWCSPTFIYQATWHLNTGSTESGLSHALLRRFRTRVHAFVTYFPFFLNEVLPPVPAHGLGIVTRPETAVIATAAGGTRANRTENTCMQAAVLFMCYT